MSYVYILECQGNRYYIGSTSDIEKRLKHHFSLSTPSTKRLKPIRLIFKQQYDNLTDARRIEVKLKRFKRKEFIEKIVKEGYIKIKP